MSTNKKLTEAQKLRKFQYRCINPRCDEETSSPDGLCEECVELQEARAACKAIPDLGKSDGGTEL